MSFLGSILNTNITTTKSDKDQFGIFTTVQEFRSNGTLKKKSVLTGTSPYYSTRTVTEYDLNGTTVLKTTVYTLTYDGVDLISEVEQI